MPGDTSSRSGTGDFLNNYFFKRIPLDNNTFQFSLEKVIVGYTRDQSNRYYNENQEGAFVFSHDVSSGYGQESGIKFNSVYLPEVLSRTEIQLYRGETGVLFDANTSVSSFAEKVTIATFNSSLPSIQVIKDKLFIVTYGDGEKENFLYNQLSVTTNNQRQTFQMQLASESMNSDGNKNDKRDIVWTCLTIGGETYLALSYNQLLRLKIPLCPLGHVLELTDEGMMRVTPYQRNDKRSISTTFYIERKKDNFMTRAAYLNPDDLVYLFKLK